MPAPSIAANRSLSRLRMTRSLHSGGSATARQSRPRKSARDAKWSFCLTAGTMGPQIRRDQEQTSPPEPLTGLQGEGGAGGHQGRPDDSPTGRAFRRPPQSDYGVEIAAGGQCFRDFRTGRRAAGRACSRCEVAACQDRRTDAGERFFRRSAHQGGIAERKAMIDRGHDLSITKQAEVLKISRGSVYYLPRPVSSADLAIIRHRVRLDLGYPFAGSRMLRGLLALQGCKIGRRHVKTLMRRMGIEALYRRPRTTKPEPGHKIYPYLLRGIEITRPNQVWAMDITYIPMARGFVYLAVVLDWFSRRVLSWRVSITMEAAFCVETLEDALARHGKPDIFNTDQGSQFTGAAFTGVLAGNGIAISMDGKGAWRDNVFVERLWKSVKYEEVYLRAYETVGEARSSIGRYLDFYNRASEHPSVYVVEEKKICWPQTGPAGCLTVLRARSTIDLAASDESAARPKIQTPSGSG